MYQFLVHSTRPVQCDFSTTTNLQTGSEKVFAEQRRPGEHPGGRKKTRWPWGTDKTVRRITESGIGLPSPAVSYDTTRARVPGRTARGPWGLAGGQGRRDGQA